MLLTGFLTNRDIASTFFKEPPHSTDFGKFYMHVIVVTHKIQIKYKKISQMCVLKKKCSYRCLDKYLITLFWMPVVWSLSLRNWPRHGQQQHRCITDLWCRNEIRPSNRCLKLELISFCLNLLQTIWVLSLENDGNRHLLKKTIQWKHLKYR